MIIIPQYNRNKLPKTGQITSYANHDDGAIEAGLNIPDVRFEIENIGGIELVKDHHTRLMWPRDFNCALSNYSNTYSWSLALNYIDGVNAGSGYGSFNDWKMPNFLELFTLLKCEYDGVNWIYYQDWILNMLTGYVWSSTTAPNSTPLALAIRFLAFSLTSYTKSNYVRFIACRSF